MLLARSWPALAPVAVAALAAEFGRRPAEPPELPEAQVCGDVS
jgi:hypothetical protein